MMESERETERTDSELCVSVLCVFSSGRSTVKYVAVAKMPVPRLHDQYSRRQKQYKMNTKTFAIFCS